MIRILTITLIDSALTRVVASVVCLVLCVNLVQAHTPHDDVQKLVISPAFETDHTLFLIVYAGPRKLGTLFRSTDRGTTWQRIEDRLTNRTRLVTDISVSKSNPSQVLIAISGDGIYRSPDKGNSWSKIAPVLSDSSFKAIVTDPVDADHVVVLTDEGKIFYTTDMGLNWKKTEYSAPAVTAIAFAQAKENRFFMGNDVGSLLTYDRLTKTQQDLGRVRDSQRVEAIFPSPTYDQDKLVFVLSTGGQLTRVETSDETVVERIHLLPNEHVTSVALSPAFATDGKVFATSWENGVYCSEDKGRTWNQCSTGLTKNKQADKKHVPHFKSIVTSSAFSSDSTLYVAGYNGAFKSTDGGIEWTNMNIFEEVRHVRRIRAASTKELSPHVIIATFFHGLHVRRPGEEKWIHTDSGMINTQWITKLLQNEPLTFDRLLKKRAFPLTNVLSVEFSPDFSNDNTIFMTSVRRLYVSQDGGLTWKHRSNSPAISDHYLGVPPSYGKDRKLYLAATHGPILMSKNAGKSFEVISELTRATRIPEFGFDPNFRVNGTMYLTGYEHCLQISRDFGNSWECSRPQDLAAKVVGTIASIPNKEGTVYVGTSRGLYRFSLKSMTWKQIGLKDLEQNYVETVALSPNFIQDSALFVGARGRGLFRSRDGGHSFERLRDYNAGDICVSPMFEHDKTLYIADGSNALVSHDSGAHWAALNLHYPQNHSLLTLSLYRIFGWFGHRRIIIEVCIVILVLGVIGKVILHRRRLQKAKQSVPPMATT